MSILTLGYNFENKQNYINIKKYINTIKGHIISNNDNFKNSLKEIEIEFRQDTQFLSDIKDLNYDDLNFLNQNIKKFNTDFDKLNNLYYDKNYFDDGELKQLFASISRQAHKVENTSHKYLYVNEILAQTPNYIKEGLAKFSTDAITEKLSPKS